jgi:hypothetical protein
MTAPPAGQRYAAELHVDTQAGRDDCDGSANCSLRTVQRALLVSRAAPQPVTIWLRQGPSYPLVGFVAVHSFDSHSACGCASQ